jgi:two-component system response regulator DesR
MATLINLESDLTVCGRVGTADRALAAIKRMKPDLVVTDLNMPGKSGLELIREISDLNSELPVVAVSVHDDVSHAQRALRAGAKAYVAKSAGGEKLVRTIRRVIRRWD